MRKIIKTRLFLCLVIAMIFFSGTIHTTAQENAVSKPEVLMKEEISATIDVSKTGSPIHPYVYGMFTELLFNIFDQGLWAEMLSDRKFFYPVDTIKQLNPVDRRWFHKRWRPTGGVDFVIMDTKNPWSGEHSPKIQLNGDKTLGIQQSGLSVKQGRSYSGYIILAGDAGVNVKVGLVWGPEPGDNQYTQLSNLSKDYKKYAFSFTPGLGTDSCRMEITGTGKGMFEIGAVSLMPADNIDGWRTDLIHLLRELNSGIYRWPGGNMVSGYDWRDGIGDRDKRPTRYDYAWNTIETNDVGTDEYMNLCKLLDIDPYICVNAGFGDDFSAAQWVEYVNGDNNTAMGKLRNQNGHPEPYNVEWWGIGNEMYGQWQLGHMSIDQYVIKHNMFAASMRKVDPTIKLIASGATPFETSTTARHHRKPLPSKLPYQYGSPEDWTGNLLEHSLNNIDFVSEHMYPYSDHYFNIDSQKFIPSYDPMTDQIRRLPNRVEAAAEAWNEYLKRMPALKDKNITYAIDEWTGGGWRTGFLKALYAAEGLHEMFRHSDIITMGGYTAVTGCLEFNANDACYSSVGLLFKLYRQEFGTLPLIVSGNSPQHPVSGTIGVDKPEISSGSETWPLDVVAALTSDKKYVTIAVVNPTENIQPMKLTIEGVRLKTNPMVYQIISPTIKSENTPEDDSVIKIRESTLKKVPGELQIPPISISLYKFEIKQ